MSSLSTRTPLDGRGGEKQWAESAQDRRVRAALKRQRSRRRDLSMHARRVATGTFESTLNHLNPSTHPHTIIPDPTLTPSTFPTIPTPMDIDTPVHPSVVSTTKSTSHNQRSTTTKGRRGHSRESATIRRKYAEQLSHHDWMLSLPSDLAHRNALPGAENQVGWYVSPRPEGRRCLVTAHGGETVARDKNGSVIGRFQSALPHGSKQRGKKQRSKGDSSSFGNGYSILDCILQEEEIPDSNAGGTFGLTQSTTTRRSRILRTYWVIDLMCWKGYSLYDCNVTFRTYWLQTKMSEEVDDQTHQWTVFRPIPRYDCTPEGLQLAYTSSNTSSCKTDGLLFMHRNGHYAPGPIPTPLVLVWKDGVCGASHFATSSTQTLQDSSSITTPTSTTTSTSTSTSTAPDNLVILCVQSDGTLTTQDQIPLGKVALSATSEHRPNDCLKFQVDGVVLNEGQHPLLVNPKYMGKCNKNRMSAHTMSRILYHHHVLIPTLEILVQQISTTCTSNLMEVEN